MLLILILCIPLLGLSFDKYCCKLSDIANNSSLSQTRFNSNDYFAKSESCCAQKPTNEFSHHQSSVATSRLTTENRHSQTAHHQCCSAQNASACLCFPGRSDNSGQGKIKNTLTSFVRINILNSELVKPLTNVDTHNKLWVANSFLVSLKIPIYLQNLSLLI